MVISVKDYLDTRIEDKSKLERNRAFNDVSYVLKQEKFYTQQKLYIQLIDFLWRIGYYEDNESYFV